MSGRVSRLGLRALCGLALLVAVVSVAQWVTLLLPVLWGLLGVGVVWFLVFRHR